MLLKGIKILLGQRSMHLIVTLSLLLGVNAPVDKKSDHRDNMSAAKVASAINCDAASRVSAVAIPSMFSPVLNSDNGITLAAEGYSSSYTAPAVSGSPVVVKAEPAIADEFAPLPETDIQPAALSSDPALAPAVQQSAVQASSKPNTQLISTGGIIGLGSQAVISGTVSQASTTAASQSPAASAPAPVSDTPPEAVLKVNHPPVLDPIGDKAGSEGSLIKFTMLATDPDGDTPVYSVSSALPEGASFDAGTHTFTWTPDFGRAGSYPVTFSVTDGKGTALETINITVAHTNRPPALTPIGDRTVIDGQALTFSLSATDPDGDALTYSATGLPVGAIFDPNTRTFTWTPSHDQIGGYSVTFTVTDGSIPVTQTVAITVTNGLSKWEGPATVIDDNSDPLNLSAENPGHVLFVNSCSPNWTNPASAGAVRTMAMNPATPAPSLDVIMNNNVLQPGDTVYMRGGIYYHGMYGSLQAQVVGTAALPVKIMSYPGEQAILTGMIIAKGWQPYQIMNGNMVYKKTFDPNGGYPFIDAAQNDMPLAGFSGSAWRIKLETFAPHENIGMYYTQGPGGLVPNSDPNDTANTVYVSLPNNGNPDDPGNTIRVGQLSFLFITHGTSLTQSSYYILDNLTFEYADTAIKINPYANVEIRNCTIKNLCDQGIFLGQSETVEEANGMGIIHDNCFDNIGATRWSWGIYDGAANTQVYHNQFNNAQLGLGGYNFNRNIQVWDNVINPGKAAVLCDGINYVPANFGQGGTIAEYGKDDLIYNNIIYGGIGISATGGKIFNNIFYSGSIVYGGLSIGTSTDNEMICNNIFYITDGQAFLDDESRIYDASHHIVMDYNLYYCASGKPAYAGILVDINTGIEKYDRFFTNSDFEGYKSFSGHDQHSVFAQDPLFVNIETKDFHLQSSSPAIGAGQDVEIGGNTVPDYYGTSRTRGHYDIGAVGTETQQ